jgi:hypothetical protein
MVRSCDQRDPMNVSLPLWVINASFRLLSVQLAPGIMPFRAAHRQIPGTFQWFLCTLHGWDVSKRDRGISSSCQGFAEWFLGRRLLTALSFV